MKKLLIILAVVVVAVLVVRGVVAGRGGHPAGKYETVEVTRGDVENVVSATGTLSAVGTVDVGTQVSGTIAGVFVDYNESVSRGQVLAVLDTTLLAASVRDAEGKVMAAQAQSDQAASDYERARDLLDQKLVSETEFQTAETAAASARGSLLSSQAAFDRARVNLDDAVIRSPIDGTVIVRNVETGQTVAASFSTPTLFVIAENLADMEIHALVDESDIGEIKVGQAVRFTVEAYPDETFRGTVRQIWLQPETVESVVNYTVVVDASNEGGLLFPGMTASTDFLINQKRDVLVVSNAALRFRPTEATTAEESAQAASGGGGSSGDGRSSLWYLDESGKPAVAEVRTGLTDGRITEIVEGSEIREGMKVLSGMSEGVQSQSGSTNPLSTPFGRRP
jgi:HlyD family secretion protein